MDDTKDVLETILNRLDSIDRRLAEKEKNSGTGRLDELEAIVKRFVAERCTVIPTRQCIVADFYKKFAEWCRYYKIDIPHQTTFGKVLIRSYPEISTGHRSKGGVPVRHYFGIGVNQYWAGNPDADEDYSHLE